eukprot:3445575-Pleurochrysis_carterae.AAC.1
MRSEMTIVGKMLAARRVAELKRIVSFGLNETSKFQVSTLSTNVQGETASGATFDIDVLRGAFVIPGGTAAHVVDAVEKKLFARGRKYLWHWMDKLEEMRAADAACAAWSGPRPCELSLERLAESLVMSDTWNAARATKRQLAAVVEAAARDGIGEESGEEQGAATRVYTGDCAQHLIILAAISAAGAAHLEAKLEESLQHFFAFERIGTEINSLIRAVYKEIEGDAPAGGRLYAKCKGKREFALWLKINHGASFYIPLERADGGRQDLDFNGALPIYINRRFMVAFLKDLVFQLEHSNILKDFLWTVLRSEEMVALCRTCTLFDLPISRPLRWLAGKAATLLDWSPFEKGWAYSDLLEEAMVAAADNGAYLYEPTLSVL